MRMIGPNAHHEEPHSSIAAIPCRMVGQLCYAAKGGWVVIRGGQNVDAGTGGGRHLRPEVGHRHCDDCALEAIAGVAKQPRPSMHSVRDGCLQRRHGGGDWGDTHGNKSMPAYCHIYQWCLRQSRAESCHPSSVNSPGMLTPDRSPTQTNIWRTAHINSRWLAGLLVPILSLASRLLCMIARILNFMATYGVQVGKPSHKPTAVLRAAWTRGSPGTP